jgi:two-component system, NtrC family, nitrogen regulation response regulator NtrX
LADYFVEIVCNEYNMPVKNYSADAYEELKGINWTGNIRELRNVVERLVILSDKTITGADVKAFASK